MFCERLRCGGKGNESVRGGGNGEVWMIVKGDTNNLCKGVVRNL